MAYPKLTPIVASGSTEPRYIGDRLADTINVKDFGAKGDGTTDDTEALQAAFAYAATKSHACVFFPTGEYRISSVVKTGGNLVVHAYGATIRGMGSNDMFSMIQNTLGYDENGPSGYSGNSNIYWYGGVLDGDGQNIDSARARQQAMFMHCTNCHMIDVVFKNGRRVHTFEFASTKDCSIRNCKFYGQYPPVIDDYYPELVQINATSEGGTPGFYGDDVECENTLIEGCLFTNLEDSADITDTSPMSGCGSHGTSVGGLPKNTVIKDCVFRGIRKYGVTCYSSNYENWVVDSCAFEGVAENGVFVRPRGGATVKSHDFTISNCIAKNCGRLFTIAGVTDDAPQYNIKILSNTYIGSGVFGTAGRSYNLFAANNYMELSSNESSSDTCCFYMATVVNAKVDGFFADLGSYTNLFTDAVRFAGGCLNSNAKNIYWTKSTSPLTINSSTVDGMEMAVNGPAAFQGISGTTDGAIEGSTGAPAIALKGASYAPHIGFPASEGLSITAYKTNENGKSVQDTRVIFVKQYDNAEAPFAVCPGTQNMQACGAPSNKWSQVYAGTGSINTSDERQKDNIAMPDEAVLRAWGKVRVKVFQFKDAVAKKGAEARVHVGIVAQDVQRAFAEEGLDATRYSLFCFDRWQAETADVVVVDAEAVHGEDGMELVPAQTHVERKLVTPAGDCYGIRYEEALALECAYQRWRLEQLEERVNQLTNNSNK